MKLKRLFAALGGPVALVLVGGLFLTCQSTPRTPDVKTFPESVRPQVPTWSADDMQFFLHGSMSTEVVPETVLRAFIAAYPDMFPSDDFSHLYAIPDPAFGWPVGFTRAAPAHLAGLPSIGVNCAACHVAEIESSSGNGRVRVLGVTAQFNSEGFFSAIVGAGFRTQDPANMRKFLAAYLKENERMKGSAKDPAEFAALQSRFDAAWEKQSTQIAAVMAADTSGAKSAESGVNELTAAQFALSDAALDSANLADLSASMLKLFHNIRFALHVPDQLPATLPPPSGPGRSDAFGLLSQGLFNAPQPPAPVKYGVVWNVEQRHFVHWDGNTRLPIARNLLAAVGLGAPLVNNHVRLIFANVQRQTDITQRIAPPRYPFPIDRSAAMRGATLYEASCASCHTGSDGDNRLYSPAQIGTDPVRAMLFTQTQADKLNDFLATVKIDGYTPPSQPGIRSTQKYWAPSLAGVWARAPYLHNGSVRTMADLLTAPAGRPASFHRASSRYDEAAMGYLDEGPFLMDTRTPANSNSGHDYGTALTPGQKHDLIEYLKTL